MSQNKNLEENKQELSSAVDHEQLPEGAEQKSPEKEKKSAAGVGMMSGMPIGLVFGMMLGHMSMNYAVMGMVIGMLIGGAVGALTDAVTKKKQ
ncbi:MAG: hypothetical protein IIU00_04860 [Clostridia bacterium]|jgi:F0F1-type ATP synthase assembly protein I|nr:hypothetical protein [Clostridia bacterium]